MGDVQYYKNVIGGQSVNRLTPKTLILMSEKNCQRENRFLYHSL